MIQNKEEEKPGEKEPEAKPDAPKEEEKPATPLPGDEKKEGKGL